MLNLAKQHDPQNEFLDFGFTAACAKGQETVNLTSSTESMKYRAVVDIDGNSWSGRFSRLLCYNSVVIRIEVEDDSEAYYMADLQPFVHYLPASLENFTQVAKWAVQNSSISQISQIIKNANGWCKWKVRIEEQETDFLTILNGYVDALNRYDSNWQDRWNQVQESLVGPNAYHLHDGFLSALREPLGQALRAKSDMQGLIVTPLSTIPSSVL